MSAFETIKMSMSVQRHVLTTGQCSVLCARMLAEENITHCEVINSMLHVRMKVMVPPGKNRAAIAKMKEKHIETARQIANNHCREIKAEKARQRSYGHHARR